MTTPGKLLPERVLAHGWTTRAGTVLNHMAGAALGSFPGVGDTSGGPLANGGHHLYLSLEVGEVCQLRCRHCIYHREHPLAPAPNPAVEAAAKEILEEGMDPIWVSISGKEPTLFPTALLRLARLAHRPERMTILMTNGLKLQGELLGELVDVIDCFDISVDGDQTAHDWMRGEGSFRKTWTNVERIVEEHSNRVGLIATAVHADLPDGRAQIAGLLSLGKLLESHYGPNDQLTLTVSLYFGAPDDPLRLSADDLVYLVQGFADISFPVRILWTSSYAHLWPEVSRRLGLEGAALKFDGITGLPFLRTANTTMILFHLTAAEQLCIRISNDAGVFLSCNHLATENAYRARLGTLGFTSAAQLVRAVSAGNHPLARRMAALPTDCSTCPDFELCRGGDALSGVLFEDTPADPYCDRITWA